jgi:hypothetical protein
VPLAILFGIELIFTLTVWLLIDGVIAAVFFALFLPGLILLTILSFIFYWLKI